MIKRLSILLMTLLSLGHSISQATPKPFNKVLVISGGGVNPGVSLGIIAGALNSKFVPDLIIVTCGANAGATIFNSTPDVIKSKEVLMSKEFFDVMSLLKIDTSNLLKLKKKMEGAKDNSVIPALFSQLVLRFPEYLPKFLNNTTFSDGVKSPRVIYVTSRANFMPTDKGNSRPHSPMFQQVYFTDAETAKLIKGWKLNPENAFPNTTVDINTDIVSNHSTVEAFRAGIADPYLLNPGFVAGHYYFTGAVDLFPLDLATALGEEVLATYPTGLFTPMEDGVIFNAYGFTQSLRSLQAIQHHDLNWIDINGQDLLNFNPTPGVLTMNNNIPENYADFRVKVASQWQFGYNRAVEGVQASHRGLDVRSHLRKPINPALLIDFTCKNAYAWKTNKVDYCESDLVSGCNRATAQTCQPLR